VGASVIDEDEAALNMMIGQTVVETNLSGTDEVEIVMANGVRVYITFGEYGVEASYDG